MRNPRGTETDWHNAALDSIGATSTQQATKPAAHRRSAGSTHYPLSAQIADTIAAHGLRWAVRHYAKRLPMWQARVLLRSAYLGG